MTKFEIILPITQAQADLAGMPAEWFERAVRSIGTEAFEKTTSPEIAKIGGWYLGMSVDKFMERLTHEDGFVLRSRSEEVLAEIKKLAASALSQREDR